MDQTDEEIMQKLEDDARASFTEIAEEVGVSEGTVRNRVEKMKDRGIIQKFTVERGQTDSVEVFVSLEVSTEREMSEVRDDLPEDIEVYELAGDIDMMLKITRGNSREVKDVVNSIRSIDGVRDTQTYMVLSGD